MGDVAGKTIDTADSLVRDTAGAATGLVKDTAGAATGLVKDTASGLAGLFKMTPTDVKEKGRRKTFTRITNWIRNSHSTYCSPKQEP